MKLTEEFKKKVQQKIVELELQTSVEFVPVITKRSSDYLLWRMIYALLVFSFSLTFMSYEFSTLENSLKVYIALGLSVLIFVLLYLEPVLHLFLSKPAMLRAVEDRAQDFFLQQEIFATAHRTGILIFVSEFEKAVFILADKGFAHKVEAAEWARLGILLATDFSKRNRGETFLAALDALAKRLSADFPPARTNLNEIPDGVREV